MRRVVFSVPPEDLEAALDGLLPVLVRGARVGEGGRIALDGTDMTRAALRAAAGVDLQGWGEEQRDGLDDGREPPVLVGGRIMVRSPEQLPPPAGVTDVVVDRSGSAFGSGTHPTTRLCLELMLDLEPGGDLADLGCGLGVLAIAAARLGWDDVVGVDRDGEGVRLAEQNAARNGVSVAFSEADLLEQAVPYRRTLLVNASPEVHRRVCAGLPPEVRDVVASSFTADEVDEVVAGYRAGGLRVARVAAAGGWVALRLTREAGEDEPVLLPDAPDAPDGPSAARRPPPAVAEALDPDRAMAAGAAFGQLARRTPTGDLSVSAARLVERGARVAVLLVPGLFRFDLTPGREAYAVSLRELCDVPMRWEAEPGTIDGFRRGTGEPMVFRGAITLPDARLGVGLQALSATDDDVGAVHVLATATVRRQT